MLQGSRVVFSKKPSQNVAKGLVLQLEVLGGLGFEWKSARVCNKRHFLQPEKIEKAYDCRKRDFTIT